MMNDIWQSRCLDLVNVVLCMQNFIKIFQMIQEIERVSLYSEFESRQILDQCQMIFDNLLGVMMNGIWQSICLHLVNSNVYAKFYQNIPKGSGDRARFTFFRI